MASQSATSAADSLIRAADRMGETTARSAMDSTFQDFKLPTDPNELAQMYGKRTGQLSTDLGLDTALNTSRDTANDAALAAGSIFENRIKSEELAKTPIGDLEGEINRLSEMRWGILPQVLARSDIIDYGTKIKLAAQAEGIVDGEITRLVNTRQSLQSAADQRAKDRTDELKAAAGLLDKKALAAKNDLDARISLFKEGRGTLDDIVQAAMELRKANDEKNKAGSGGSANPFLGLTGGTFSQAEIVAFQYFESFGKWPVVDSAKTQYGTQLSQRYSQWVGAGKPTGGGASKPPVLQDPTVQSPTDYYGAFKPQTSTPTPPAVNPFQPVADNQKKNAAAAMMQFLMGAGG